MRHCERLTANNKRTLSEQKRAPLNVFIIEMNSGANVELAHCNYYDSSDVINSSGKISRGSVAYEKHSRTLPMS